MNDSFEQNYWEPWYQREEIGSGDGSRGILLEYKANSLNAIYEKYHVGNVFDFGCGDGYLVSKLNCKTYYGVDISETSVKLCNERVNKPNFYFEKGHFYEQTIDVVAYNYTSKFKVSPDIVTCIDVLYHIIDEAVFNKTVENIFSIGAKVVVLYTIPDEKALDKYIAGMYPRTMAPILSKVAKDYTMVERKKIQLGSNADFFIYLKNNK